MAAVNSLGPGQLQSWMVRKLFNTQGQTSDAKSVASAPSVGPPGNKISGSTLSAMSLLGDRSALDPVAREAPWKIVTLSYDTSTRQISGLTDQMSKDFFDYATGPDLPPLAPGMPPQQKQLGLVGRMMQIKQVNEMDSQQISDAFYGDGLPVGDPEFGDFIGGPNLKFSSFIRDSSDSVAGSRLLANRQDIPEDQRQNISIDADREEQRTKSMLEAYNNHTLTFMKIADIPGADYHATMTYSTSNTVTDIGDKETYNKSAVNEYISKHPNSIYTNFGGASMIWSW